MNILISFLEYDHFKVVANDDVQNNKIGLGGFWVENISLI